MADRETDHTAQCMQYLEAVLFFLLTGNTMENERPINDKTPYTMYKDTLNLIKYVHYIIRSYMSLIQLYTYTFFTVFSLRVIKVKCESNLCDSFMFSLVEWQNWQNGKNGLPHWCCCNNNYSNTLFFSCNSIDIFSFQKTN